MPPTVASVVYLAIVVWLLRRDIRQRPNITGALWLPTIWLLVIGSKGLSQWLGMFGFSVGGSSVEEGSPVDALFYFTLIAAGIRVLMQRQVRLNEIFYHNRWLAIFLIYCLISVVWSDYPFVSFKRWIKILGHPIMTLVVFSEPDPEEALTRMVKRAAYVLVPISILFIKYYPEWGRQFDPWSGLAVNTGITTDKNSLGCVCLVLGFFQFWHLVKTWKRDKTAERKREIWFCGGLFLMTAWLLRLAQSSTSMVTLFVAMMTVLFLGLRQVNHRMLGIYLAAGVMLFFMANALFGIVDIIIAALGKNPTLTDRTQIWHSVLQVPIDPIFGTGFESFWLGERKDRIWEIFWFHPNEAHNGYLETYLNLGLIGLGLMLILIVSAFKKGVKMLPYNLDFARFRLGFLTAFVLYNWTEAAFKALHPVWFVFYLISIDVPKPVLPLSVVRVAGEDEIMAEEQTKNGLET